MSAEYLHTTDLTIGYKRSAPLARNLDLSLFAGETVCLIGGNGVGKSTLMRTLCGELRPLHGDISIMGTPIAEISRRRLATLISLAGTDQGMAGGLTVRQLVELGRQPHTGLFGLLCNSDKEICDQAMQATGIYYKRDAFVATLSDGERQKAMIARALAQDTPIMYLDEPFSFLDPSSRLEIMDMLISIAHEKSKAILLTCHDVALSLRMASRLWLFLHDGAVKSFNSKEAIESGLLNKLYESEAVTFSPEIGDFIVSNHSK